MTRPDPVQTGCHMASERHCSAARVLLAGLVGALGAGLASCHAPPFSAPQPAPDWSDAEKQCRASVEIVECTEAYRPGVNSGCWVLRLRTRAVSNSREVSEDIAYEFLHLSEFATRVGMLRVVGGAPVHLLEPDRPWIAFSDSMTRVDPTLPEDPIQLPSGDWETIGPALLIVSPLPVGEAELSIDGEALRTVMSDRSSRGQRLSCIPVGGLTGKVSVFQVPAATPDQRNAKPTEGSGIGVSPPVR